MSGHCELCGETGGHSAACVSNPYQAANQRVIIATLTADLARLTAELERSRRECERLREALVEVQAARYREQGMKVEQSYIHAKCDVDRERIRFAREALATGGRHD